MVSSTLLLEAILFVLEVVDAIYNRLITIWFRIAAPAGSRATARKAGSRPPPPKVVGIILAEPDVSDVSIRTVTRLTSW